MVRSNLFPGESKKAEPDGSADIENPQPGVIPEESSFKVPRIREPEYPTGFGDQPKDGPKE